VLIAVAGLAGAGKTTAVQYLQSRGVGQLVYVGAYVRAEVQRRNLAPTPENEQAVRQSLRDELGREALAKMAVHNLQARNQSERILLDAICVKEECDFYRAVLGLNVLIIGIYASFDIRANRLEMRGSRPLSADQLRQRDRFECKNLGLEDVLSTSEYRLTNEGSLKAFESKLDVIAAEW
jgi:dephospho-CoA kinase